jgi:predicted nucleotidyltransferase
MRHLDPKLLDTAVQRIVDALQPEVVYLCGSHAYGRPGDDSDVDCW